MIKLPLKQIATALGKQYEGDVHISGVSIDSRTLNQGNLFFAIEGENFNGHDYIMQAIERGAAAVVVLQPCDKLPVAQIRVDDTHKALIELAHYWRALNNWLVVAITGSNGKTTVKEMTARILAEKYTTQMTEGNLNNDFGVPLTLLSCRAETEALVVEMGANHAGEIALLSKTANPDIALVNNIAAAHIEGFGSLQGVAEAKAEIYQGLRPQGTVILNADDDFAPFLRRQFSQSCIDYAINKPATVSLVLVNEQGFEVLYLNHRTRVKLPLGGKHNIANALAAISIGLAAGIDVQTSAQALQGFDGVAGRLQIKKGMGECTIIDDSYNANIASMKAGIDYLISRPGQHWALLGAMAELGDQSEQLHGELANYAREQGVERLYISGSIGEKMCQCFGKNCFYDNDRERLAEQIMPLLNDQVNLLIKGSRSAAMEYFVNRFTRGGTQC